MNSRNFDVCNFDVHRASFVKHLRKKTIGKRKANELIITDWLIQEPVENKIHKMYIPKPSKQIASYKSKLGDKQLNKEIAKKMINQFYFTDKNWKVGFNITLESHHINQAKSKLIKLNQTIMKLELKFVIILKLNKIYLFFMLVY